MARPAQVFKIDLKAKDQVSELIAVEEISALKEFCVALLNFAIDNNKEYVTRSELETAQRHHVAVVVKGQPAKPMATAASTLSERIASLVEIKTVFVYQDDLDIEGKSKKYRVHFIKDLSGLISFLKADAPQKKSIIGRPKTKSIKMMNEALSTRGLIHLKAGNNLVAHTQGAFAILLASCKSGGDKQDVIEAEYKFTPTDRIKIRTTTSSDADIDILHISDHRIMVALNGMLRRENQDTDDLFGYEPTRMVNGYCFFDIFALTKEIGLQANKSENRARVRKMVERLEATTFKVDASFSPHWQKYYMPDSSFSEAKYRYITEFYSASDWNDKQHENPDLNDIVVDEDEQRFFVVKFHPLISSSMETGDHAFITHPSLKTEKYDLPHLINNWVKGVVGVSKFKEYPIGHHQYTIDIFGERCAPTIRIDNFERAFYSLAKRQDSKEDTEPHSESVRFSFDENGKIIPDGTFWLNGYYFKVHVDEELSRTIYRKTRTMRRHRVKVYPVLTIWRDKEDPLVGDNSDHNLALSRQYAELAN